MYGIEDAGGRNKSAHFICLCDFTLLPMEVCL